MSIKPAGDASTTEHTHDQTQAHIPVSYGCSLRLNNRFLIPYYNHSVAVDVHKVRNFKCGLC
jgi:hypothetical protein